MSNRTFLMKLYCRSDSHRPAINCAVLQLNDGLADALKTLQRLRKKFVAEMEELTDLVHTYGSYEVSFFNFAPKFIGYYPDEGDVDYIELMGDLELGIIEVPAGFEQAYRPQQTKFTEAHVSDTGVCWTTEHGTGGSVLTTATLGWGVINE